jgi:hypothetical protein
MKSPNKDLSPRLEQRLSAYAMAATAAGVGVLSLTQPAQARIVYTPAHQRIKVNRGVFHIDLNHDGIPDFGLKNFHSQSSGSLSYLREIQSATQNEVLVVATHSSCPVAALPKGKRIGPKGPWSHNTSGGRGQVMALRFKTTCGHWAGQRSLQAYLGLKFVVKGSMHFGWARVKVDTVDRPYSAILTGYAYETIPNRPIVAGKTKEADLVTVQSDTVHGTLGHLALGRK